MYNDYKIENVELLNYVGLSKKELLKTLEWRNNVNIRSKMFNSNIITENDHLNFVESLKQLNERTYWLCRHKGRDIGVIYLYNWNKQSVWWGYFSNPEFLTSSYGVLMEQVVMELVFNKLNYKELLCESLRTNTSVLKIHKLFGFKEISIENRVVIMKNNKNQWAEQKEELAPLMNMFRR